MLSDLKKITHKHTIFDAKEYVINNYIKDEHGDFGGFPLTFICVDENCGNGNVCAKIHSGQLTRIFNRNNIVHVCDKITQKTKAVYIGQELGESFYFSILRGCGRGHVLQKFSI